MTSTRTFTRTELTAALATLGRTDLAAGLYARRVADPDLAHRVGSTCLALDYDQPADTLVLTVAFTALLGPDDAADWAAAATPAIPAHPAGPGIGGLMWPGWVLDEPTAWQWADMVRECPACEALDDDGPCIAHERAPWDVTAQLAAATI